MRERERERERERATFMKYMVLKICSTVVLRTSHQYRFGYTWKGTNGDLRACKALNLRIIFDLQQAETRLI